MKQTSKCALGGITAALSLFLLISVALVPFLTYVLPAIAGVLIYFIVIEIDKKWAFGVYSAVSVLGIFLVPDKELAVIYIAFFGYYPILKSAVENHTKRLPGLLIKEAVFLASMIISYYLMMKFMGITIDETEEFGKWAYLILLGMGSVTFILYDFVLTKIFVVYNIKWRRKFKKFFK